MDIPIEKLEARQRVPQVQHVILSFIVKFAVALPFIDVNAAFHDAKSEWLQYLRYYNAISRVS